MNNERFGDGWNPTMDQERLPGGSHSSLGAGRGAIRMISRQVWPIMARQSWDKKTPLPVMVLYKIHCFTIVLLYFGVVHIIEKYLKENHPIVLRARKSLRDRWGLVPSISGQVASCSYTILYTDPAIGTWDYMRSRMKQNPCPPFPSISFVDFPWPRFGDPAVGSPWTVTFWIGCWYDHSVASLIGMFKCLFVSSLNQACIDISFEWASGQSGLCKFSKLAKP